MPQMQPLIHRTDRPLTRIKIQRTHPFHHIKQPTIGIVLHIVHNTHEYEPTETTTILLHSAQKSKRMNTLQNYYITFTNII